MAINSISQDFNDDERVKRKVIAQLRRDAGPIVLTALSEVYEDQLTPGTPERMALENLVGMWNLERKRSRLCESDKPNDQSRLRVIENTLALLDAQNIEYKGAVPGYALALNTAFSLDASIQNGFQAWAERDENVEDQLDLISDWVPELIQEQINVYDRTASQTNPQS